MLGPNPSEIKLSELAEQKRSESVLRKAARDIISAIDKWTGAHASEAAVKWIWELIQNAYDVAKSRGKKMLNVKLRVDGSYFTFEHDAGPFTIDEVNALITGGSTKPYATEGSELKGRFGKGFLVTHVISTRINVEGWIREEDHGIYRPFSISINRSEKTELAIMNNFKACTKQLDEEVSKFLDQDLTRFVYHVDSEQGKEALRIGLEHFQLIYPYISIFMLEQLKLKVEVIADNQGIAHEISPAFSQSFEGYILKGFDFIVGGQIKGSVITISLPSRGITVAFPFDTELKEIKSIEGIPRLFNMFPLIKTKILNLPVIVNADFETDDDRLEISYPGEKRKLLPPILHEIMKAIEIGFRWAVEAGVSNPEQLLVISAPPLDIGMYHPEWRQALTQLVHTFARSKTVRVRGSDRSIQLEYPSAIDFPSAKVNGERFEDPFFLEALASIAEQLKFKLPLQGLIAKWDVIRSGWETLEVRVGNSLTLERLTTYIESFKNLGNLARASGLDLDKSKKLLEEFYGLADMYRRTKGLRSFLTKSSIYCTQTGSFKPPADIYIDAGVPEELKKISKEIAEELRKIGQIAYSLEDKLLMPTKDALTEYFKSLGMRELRKDDAIGFIYLDIQRYWKLLERSSVFRQNVLIFERWLLQQENIDALLGVYQLKGLPWLCEDDQLHTVGNEPFFLPTTLLEEAKSPYVELWPKDVRLSSAYAQNLVSSSLFKKRIREHGIGCEDFITKDEVTLQPEDLKVLAAEYRPSEAVSVRVSKLINGEKLIASLQKESSYERTLKFLKFLLEYLVPRDKSCLETVEIQTRRPGIRTLQKLSIYPCLWLSQVKRVSWVLNPKKQETEEPNKANLIEYLKEMDPSILMDPQIQTFLAKHFDVSQLDLAIITLTRGKEAVAERLAQMLTEIHREGIDVEFVLREFQETVRKQIDRKRINARNRNLGRLVERIVMKVFGELKLDEIHRIRVVPTWVAYDFEAYVEGKAFEEIDVGRLGLACSLVSGELLERFEVEVKATAEDTVRMSRAQAEESALKKDRYILCVVDVRGPLMDLLEGLANQELKEEDVETLADKLKPLIYLSNVGEHLAPVIERLNDLRLGARPISIYLNPTFVIPHSIWKEKGVSLESWASSLSEKLAKERSLGFKGGVSLPT